MSETKTYRLSVFRWCGETVVGRVTQEFVDYWAGREMEHLSDYILADPDERTAGVPPARADGSTPGTWYEFDDVEHTSNAYLNNNYIEVMEVTLDPDAPGGAEPVPNGFKRTYDIAWLLRQNKEKFVRVNRALRIETAPGKAANPAIMITSLEKGDQSVAFVTLSTPFDVSQLSFEAIAFQDDLMVDGMYYAGEPLELDGEFSRGSGMFVYIGDLIDEVAAEGESVAINLDEALPLRPESDDDLTPDTPGDIDPERDLHAGQSASRGLPWWLWSMLAFVGAMVAFVFVVMLSST